MSGELVITFDGLDELARASRRARRKLGVLVGYHVRGTGQKVASRAKQQARSEGLLESGSLIDSIASRTEGDITRTTAIIEATAQRRGFPYPSLYEFARNRPFLEPALDAETPAALLGFLRIAEQVAREAER